MMEGGGCKGPGTTVMDLAVVATLEREEDPTDAGEIRTTEDVAPRFTT